MSALSGYRALVAKVDATCARIQSEYAAHIACRKGCGDCCRNISVFPVEAAVLSEAVRRLSPEVLQAARQRALEQAEACPLLNDGVCLVYDARPIICRTHGMPILVPDEDGRIDACPKNFRNLSSLPMSDVIDLNRLNEMLWAVHALFVGESGAVSKSERITIAQVVLGA